MRAYVGYGVYLEKYWQEKLKSLSLPSLCKKLNFYYCGKFEGETKKLVARRWNETDSKRAREKFNEAVYELFRKCDDTLKERYPFPLLIFQTHLYSCMLFKVMYKFRNIRNLSYVYFDYHADLLEEEKPPYDGANFVNYILKRAGKVVWIQSERDLHELKSLHGPLHLSIDLDVLYRPKVGKKGLKTERLYQVVRYLLQEKNIVAADISEYGGMDNMLRIDSSKVVKELLQIFSEEL